MDEIIEKLKTKLSYDDMALLSKSLVSCYSPFDSLELSWRKLINLFPASCHNYILEFQKEYSPNYIYNAIILKFYKGENIVKYNLAKQNINNEDEVAIFELGVNSSRLDFSRINGQSYAYEIKTELDNTDRLQKQISDYEKVFEKIYVVIHPSHMKRVKEIIPRKCGIISYEIREGECDFCIEREALLNKGIKKEAQIQNFTSSDYAYILKQKGIKNIPAYKDEREVLIRRLCNKQEMNDFFKIVLKEKNKKRWEHIKLNIDMLLPIDIQDFFTYTLNPNDVYYRSSSIDCI